MNIHVIGAGYVGAVQSAGLAAIGHNVVCFEKDEYKLAKLRDGILPFYEPDLDALIKSAVRSGHLSFAHADQRLAVPEVYFIAVGTPTTDSGKADVSAVLDAAKSIAERIRDRGVRTSEEKNLIVALKSTVPVGTADKVRAIVSEASPRFRVSIVSNPEFLREGSAVKDFFEPDRIVIGCNEAWASQIMLSLYVDSRLEGKGLRHCRVIATDNKSAELIKYASNTMLAMRISFANELARLCDACGADIEDVTKGMGADSRIGPAFFKAGAGWGGSCFGKDVAALQAVAFEHGLEFPFSEVTLDTNAQHKTVLVTKALKHFNNALANKRIAVWGLAFKPHTDDVRDAPALAIIKELVEEGASVVAYDPHANETGSKALQTVKNWSVVPTAKDAIRGTDALFICTEWPEFFVSPKELLKLGIEVVFDGRNIFDLEEMRKAGITYYSIGRGRYLGN